MSEFPVGIDRVVTLVDDDRYAAEWRGPLDGAGAVLLEVDAAGVSDRTALFSALAGALGLPAGTGLRTWSGVEDQLRQRVATWERGGAVVVVRHVGAMVDAALGELLELVSILRGLAVAANEDEVNFPNEVALRAVLTGSGPSFPAG